VIVDFDIDACVNTPRWFRQTVTVDAPYPFGVPVRKARNLTVW